MSFLWLGCCEASVGEWVGRRVSVGVKVCKQENEWVSQWVRTWVGCRRTHMRRCFKLFPRLPAHRKLPQAADIHIHTIYIYICSMSVYIFSSANKTSIAWYKLQITLNRLRLEATHGGARRCTRPQVLDALMLRCLFVPCGSIREHLSSSFRPQATHNVALPRSVDTSVVNYLSLKSLTHAAAVATTTTATPSTIMYLH